MDQFTLTILTVNETTMDDIAAALEKVAGRMRMDTSAEGVIMDTNGNKCGTYVWERE